MDMSDKRMLEIERTANKVREQCGVTGYGVNDIFELSDRLGFRTIRQPIHDKKFLGLATIKDTERIVLSNSLQILSREIFTVAHEIGHQKLHIQAGNDCRKYEEVLNGADVENDHEVEANYFAACLLMPREEVEKFIRLELYDKPVRDIESLDIARIQSTFSASYEMVIIRLKALGILDSATLSSLKKNKSEQTVTSLLKAIQGNVDLTKVTGAIKLPTDFITSVLTNYKKGLVSKEVADKALKFADFKIDDFGIRVDVVETEESLDDLIGGIEW